MPLEGDDFNWIYSGLLEAFKGGALYPFALQHSGNFIIAGCDISFNAGNATISEGFVMLNYEICYCPAQTVAVTSLAASSLKIAETYDANGAEVFADTITRDTYAIRRAIISDGLNSGVEIVLSSPARYYYNENISSFSNSWASVSGFTAKAHKIGNIVYLSGQIDSGDTNLIAFNLPAPFRPSRLVSLFANTSVLRFSTYPEVETHIITIATNGDVIPANDGNQITFSSPRKLILDGLSYWLV